LDKINGWLRQLAVDHPNDVTLINIGKSYYDRDILGVKVNIGGGSNKKSVMFEGTHHAREWISAATITWMLNELLTSTDAEITELAANYEWYIVPVTNPDGYDYTWTTNRMWRKTRKPSTNLLCIGTDPNRNWDNFFNQGGTSMNPCSDTYAGEFAFSEPETRQLAEFIKTVPNLAAYFPFHSYSQILMLPYGWTHDLLDNYHELYAIGEKALDVLTAQFGTVYKLGAIANILCE
jgi:murein tripeptide amidase MpaA